MSLVTPISKLGAFKKVTDMDKAGGVDLHRVVQPKLVYEKAVRFDEVPLHELPEGGKSVLLVIAKLAHAAHDSTSGGVAFEGIVDFDLAIADEEFEDVRLLFRLRGREGS